MADDPTPADTIQITIVEVDHFLRYTEVTPALASALRVQSHGAWRLPTLLEASNESIGPEELAGLLFLARRQNGESVSYDQVCTETPKAADVIITFLAPGDEVPEDADPNA